MHGRYCLRKAPRKDAELKLVRVWKLAQDRVMADGLEEAQGHAERGINKRRSVADVEVQRGQGRGEDGASGRN